MGRSHLASGGSGWFYTGLKKGVNVNSKSYRINTVKFKEMLINTKSLAGVITFVSCHVLCQFDFETPAKEKVNIILKYQSETTRACRYILIYMGIYKESIKISKGYKMTGGSHDIAKSVQGRGLKSAKTEERKVQRSRRAWRVIHSESTEANHSSVLHLCEFPS